jgi:hypothetical protein
VIRRPNGADNLRRSDSIRNNCRADQRSLNYRGAKRGITAASAAGFRARTRPPGTEFLDAETGPQISPPKWVSAHRDKNPEMSRRKSPQKRPIWRRAGNARFARTGWWCAQPHANRSRQPPPVIPCYLHFFREGIPAFCCSVAARSMFLRVNALCFSA